MIPAAFEYARASSVEEAVKLLNKYGEDAKVLAGGHSLIPLMRLRLAQPKALVDINGIKGLDQIKESGGKLHIGRSDWDVVGVIDSGRGAQDSEIWGDVNQVGAGLDASPVSEVLLVPETPGST